MTYIVGFVDLDAYKLLPRNKNVFNYFINEC